MSRQEYNVLEKLKADEPQAWELIEQYAIQLGIDLSKWEFGEASIYEFDGFHDEDPYVMYDSYFINDEMEDHSLGFIFTKGYSDNPPDEWVIEKIELTQD